MFHHHRHVQDYSILFQVISRGPENTELISTFQSRHNPKYLSSLGLAVVEIAKRVPDGLLVSIFPYYSRGTVAQSVERPSKGPGSRCNSTEVGSKHADNAAYGCRKNPSSAICCRALYGNM